MTFKIILHFMKNISLGVDKCLHGAKEGYRESKRKREQDGEWEKDREGYTQFRGISINGPSIRGRNGLMLKFDELLWPLRSYFLMKYLHIHNISIHINFYQNLFLNECVKIPGSHSFRVFFVRCRRTYVLNNCYST